MTFDCDLVLRNVGEISVLLTVARGLTFNEIGSPWRGPTTWPVRAKCWSSFLACSSASSKKKSVKQVVYKDRQLRHLHIKRPTHKLMRQSGPQTERERDLLGRECARSNGAHEFRRVLVRDGDLLDAEHAAGLWYLGHVGSERVTRQEGGGEES